MTITAWLALRIVYALFFLYPLKGMLSDWQAAKDAVSVLVPIYQGFATVIMMLVMVVGAIGIGFGIYGQVAGILLLLFCVMGVVVHYRLAALARRQALSHSVSHKDLAFFKNTQDLAILGNLTSGQKNVVLAAVALFFVLVGTGPCSLTAVLW